MDTSQEVRIVELAPMRVASFQGYGTSPEEQAFEKLQGWLKAHNLMGEVRNHRVFGFNNPEPSVGSPNYGYEVWITVGPEVEPEGDMEVKTFGGGLYGVSACAASDPGSDIPKCWQQLVAWLNQSPYEHAHHQWLEEHVWTSPDADDPFAGPLTLDLYIPIRR